MILQCTSYQQYDDTAVCGMKSILLYGALCVRSMLTWPYIKCRLYDLMVKFISAVC